MATTDTQHLVLEGDFKRAFFSAGLPSGKVVAGWAPLG
jgi:hypothetical protein